MRHMLEGDNLGLVSVRQVKTGKTWQHITVSNAMVESTYLSNKTSEIDYLFPLYLYNENANGDAYKTENVKPAFRRWIDNYYGKKLSPENIIGYIYAVFTFAGLSPPLCRPLTHGFPSCAVCQRY